MSRHALAVFATFVSTACAAHPGTPLRAAGQTSPRAGSRSREIAATKIVLAESPSDEDAPGRRVGDYRVYQYAGAFTKSAVTLTEQVVAKEGDLFVVDYVLEEGKTATALRVRMKDDEVVRVARIGDDGETPATLQDYQAMIEKTQLVPDSNDELLGTEHTSCLVGEEQVDCDVMTYRVTIGGKQAKLSVTKSAKLPGCDVSGNLVADDGTVLYSARLIERGNEPSVVDTFAKLDRQQMPDPER